MAAALLCWGLLATRSSPAQADPTIPVVDLDVGVGQLAGARWSLAMGSGQAGYVQLRKGQVTGVVVPLPPSTPTDSQELEHAFFRVRASLLESEQFAPSGCGSHSAKIRTWFALNAPDALAADPSAISLWVTRGAKLFRLVSEKDSALATSALSPAATLVSGLTPAGRDVVSKVFAAGALVDVSRVSSLTFDEVVQLALQAHAPLVASQANARALADQKWNLSEAQLLDVAKTGGLVGITFDRRQLAPGRSGRIDHVVRQILHTVALIGVDHVALGSGFETGEDTPAELRSAAQFPRLAIALARAGLPRNDIERVFHGNAERLLCPR